MIRRFWLLVLLCLPVAPLTGQSLSSWLTLDARAGVSTNSYLIPFYGEWNRTQTTGYGLLLPALSVLYEQDRFSADASLGGMFEPVSGEARTLGGGSSQMNLRYRLASRWSAGLESGLQTVKTAYSRDGWWLLPNVSWRPGPFTQLKLKAGSSGRRFRNLEQGGDASSRFDLFGVDMEHALGYRWQVRGGFYGDLDDPSGTVSLYVSSDHRATDRFSVGVRAGVDQYRYDWFAPDGGSPTGWIELRETDRIWRSGVQGRFRVSDRVSLTAGADYLLLASATSESMVHDIHVSGGVRVTLRPDSWFRGGGEPEVALRESGNRRGGVQFEIPYDGEGTLYLTGAFNDWAEPGVPLVRTGRNRYAADVELEPGGHEYKIVLIEESGEQKWMPFTEDTYTVPDGFGGENGLLFIVDEQERR
ncbi:MAG: glycogen-binding domain-containing protein [Balneolaceae bacterium]